MLREVYETDTVGMFLWGRYWQPGALRVPVPLPHPQHQPLARVQQHDCGGELTAIFFFLCGTLNILIPAMNAAYHARGYP
jgi:hypothetical protein